MFQICPKISSLVQADTLGLRAANIYIAYMGDYPPPPPPPFFQKIFHLKIYTTIFFFLKKKNFFFL